MVRQNYHAANEEITHLRLSLEESRSNGERLHRESELVVQNVNTWVREQKWVYKIEIIYLFNYYEQISASYMLSWQKLHSHPCII